MSLSLLTLVSRACELHYPIIPVIESVLPIVDEIVVNVDSSRPDGTEDLIVDYLHRVFNGQDKPYILHTRPWNWDAHDAGREFARQTNETLQYCKGDWVLNLQADEIIHENDHDGIRWLMSLPEDYAGAQLNRLYFYGDLNTVRTDWTQPLVRLIRRGRGRSAGDSIQCEADGLVWPWSDGDPLIYHYSRCGDPAIIGERIRANDLMHHRQEELDPVKPYDFRLKAVDGHLRGRDATLATLDPSLLVRFEGTHPAAIQGWKW